MNHRVILTTAGEPWVELCRLRGADEEAVTGLGTADAVALIDRLLVASPGAAFGPGEADRLTAPDRDLVLAAIQVAEFGPVIASTLTCIACARLFDTDFVLADLLASLHEYADWPRREPDGTWRLADGSRFRLPCGRDELALGHLAPGPAEAELLRRCLIGDAASPAEVAAAMEAVGPIVAVDLAAHCPDCGAGQTLHFDLQDYLLGALMQEAPARLAEFHLLAAAYHWRLGEILSLERAQRRGFAAAIERERTRWPAMDALS